MEHDAMSKTIKQDHLEISREKQRLKYEIEKVEDYKEEISTLKTELKEQKSRQSKLQSESDSSFKEHFQLKEQLRIVSEGAKRDYEQSVNSLQRFKSMESETKSMKNVQENLNNTLNQVKSENSIIIQGLKSNLELKEREITRMSSELKEKNMSTQSILEKEKENTGYKTSLMENTIMELKKDLNNTKKEYGFV